MAIIKKWCTLGFILLGLTSMAAHAITTYQLDPNHSFVNYKIKHFDFSSQTGKWAAEGTLKLDDAEPAKSSVNVTINVANVITGIPELEKHLKGPLFFDVGQYPTATFVSKNVIPEGKNKAKVLGSLTLKGVTNDVTLDVTLNKHAINPINEKMTAGFTATTVIKRSDFGMKSLLPGLGDEVTIDISAEATKQG